MPFDTTNDSVIALAQGNANGAYAVYQFGAAIGVNTTLNEVWNGNPSIGAYQGFLANAGTITFRSSSALDTAAGSGARTIRFEGLDQNYGTTSIVGTFNGVNDVSLGLGSFIRLNRAIVTTAGGSQTNVGIMTAAIQGGTCLYMPAARGQSLVAVYTVPANYSGYLYSIDLTGGGNADNVQIEFSARPFGGAWNDKNIIYLNANGGKVNNSYRVPLRFTQKTDLRIRAATTTSTASVGAAFELVVIPDGGL